MNVMRLRSGTLLAILIVGILSIALVGTVQGRPPYATSYGNSCESCHTKNLVPGKMQVSDTGVLTDLGTQLNGKVRGPLKTFRVQAGNIITLSVDVLDGNDKFAAQLKRLEKGGQANDETNVLVWSEANGDDNVWTRQEFDNPPYFTKDNGNSGGISGSVTPVTYTFDLLVDAATPPDVYDLEFAAASPTQARELHDALLVPNQFIDPTTEIKWATSKGGICASFTLQDKTCYLKERS